MTTTPRLAFVEITGEPGSRQRSVTPVWDGVDRPRVGGWLVKDARTAQRLRAAILDGNVFTDVHVATDNAGKTYVASRSAGRVLGRTMDADLRKLGY